MNERSLVRIPARAAGEFSPGSTFGADSYKFLYPFHPGVTAVARQRSRLCCQKSAGGRSQLNG